MSKEFKQPTILEQFLRKKRILRRFQRGLKRIGLNWEGYNMTNGNKASGISGGFSWHSSIEGLEFWVDIDDAFDDFRWDKIQAREEEE